MNPEPFTLASLNPNPPRRRRTWLWAAVAVASLMLVGGGVTAGLLLAGSHQPAPTAAPVVPTAASTAGTPSPDTSTTAAIGDPYGRAACATAKQWNDAGQADITEALVTQIHAAAIRSTVADIVYRGDALYDAWNTTKVEAQTQGLSGPEVQLRLMAPMLGFETACVNARYTS